MSEGKWIAGMTADAPLTKAAHHALSVRLRTVAHALPLAVQESDRDPEYVHQLRVATRRADAALRLFASCLPRKIHKAARTRLRRLRRAAGAAHDWDVFLLALAERRLKQPEKDQAGLNFLFGYAYGHRTVAQAELETVGDEEHSTFDAFRETTAAAVRPSEDLPDDATLLDLARPLLTGLLRELEWTASGDLEDYAHLHQVRIAGKRLRYAMEVFADCFPASFREELYPRVEEMQEILGRANDSHVAEGAIDGPAAPDEARLGGGMETRPAGRREPAALPSTPAAAGAEAVSAMVGGMADKRGAGAERDAGRRRGAAANAIPSSCRRAGMSSSTVETREALAVRVDVTEDTLSVELVDGRTIAAPVAWYPRLAHATAEERAAWRLIGGGRGIHWPGVDEDVSVANLLAGQPSAESQSSFKRWLAGRSKTGRVSKASLAHKPS